MEQFNGYKKIIATALGFAVIFVGMYIMDLPFEKAMVLAAPFLSYNIGQGLADLGKYSRPQGD